MQLEIWAKKEGSGKQNKIIFAKGTGRNQMIPFRIDYPDSKRLSKEKGEWGYLKRYQCKGNYQNKMYTFINIKAIF